MRKLTSKLCVGLFVVTQPHDQLLTGHRFLVAVAILLSHAAQVASEDVCIGCDSSHTARHIPGGGNNLQLYLILA